MKEKVRLINLHKSFGSRHVLRGVDLSIYEGETLCIIGRSGSGKSVIIKHLIGLLDPDEGQIIVNGERADRVNAADRRRICGTFGVLFQGAALFDSMDLFDNIAFGLRRKQIQESTVKTEVDSMIDILGLCGLEHVFPSELSGGFQKRVALARSLLMKPEIMLYDEPTTGVDPVTAAAVDSIIVRAKSIAPLTSVVITHDMRSAFRIADRIAMLHEGKIIFTGTPADLQNTVDPLLCQFIEGRANGPIQIS
jgi:phospholipid/cholesterol/gamma-HCH transport system ATP-binding protein